MNPLEIMIGEQLYGVLENMQEGVEIVDVSGNILYVNKSFIKITGYQSEERLKKNIFHVHPKGSLVKVLESKSAIRDIKHFTKKEILGLFNVTPIYKDEKMLGAILFCQEISDLANIFNKSIQHDIKKDYKESEAAKFELDDIIGNSKAVTGIKNLIRLVAPTDATILLEGETGTGKELFVHAIHNISPRRGNPFIQINCAAIPENLLESELFGHEKGAFTDASRTKKGMFELAHNGTIFLDEIGEMNGMLQAKLLRVLQNGEIRRIGGSDNISVNVRIISATNRKLFEMIKTGSFRQDLYYRLNVVNISIPPLRERREDISPLTHHLIDKTCKHYGKPPFKIEDSALSLLQEYDWPGNIRELENVIIYAVLVNSNGIIEANDIISKLQINDNVTSEQNFLSLEQVEKSMIIKALKTCGASSKDKQQAADNLGISISTLYNKIKKYNISL